MQDLQQLKTKISELQAQLELALEKEKAQKIAQGNYMPYQSRIVSYETDGIRECVKNLLVFHAGLKFDFSTPLSERDIDNRRESLYDYEEQGHCVIVEE